MFQVRESLSSGGQKRPRNGVTWREKTLKQENGLAQKIFISKLKRRTGRASDSGKMSHSTHSALLFDAMRSTCSRRIQGYTRSTKSTQNDSLSALAASQM